MEKIQYVERKEKFKYTVKPGWYHSPEINVLCRGLNMLWLDVHPRNQNEVLVETEQPDKKFEIFCRNGNVICMNH